jgi:stearoyl-CoA desaturase (delta-9 desaturase)
MPPLIRNRNEDAQEEVRSIIDNKKDIHEDVADVKPEEPYKMEIVWRNVAVMAYMHLAGLYGLYLCFTGAMFKTVVAGK